MDEGIAWQIIAEAQAALAEYVQPGGPGEHETLTALLSILDNETVVRAQRAASPQPIATLKPEPDTSYLLYCPEQGGWHVGEWWEPDGGQWIAAIDTESRLEPTMWMPAPPEPECPKTP